MSRRAPTKPLLGPSQRLLLHHLQRQAERHRRVHLTPSSLPTLPQRRLTDVTLRGRPVLRTTVTILGSTRHRTSLLIVIVPLLGESPQATIIGIVHRAALFLEIMTEADPPRLLIETFLVMITGILVAVKELHVTPVNARGICVVILVVAHVIRAIILVNARGIRVVILVVVHVTHVIILVIAHKALEIAAAPIHAITHAARVTRGRVRSRTLMSQTTVVEDPLLPGCARAPIWQGRLIGAIGMPMTGRCTPFGILPQRGILQPSCPSSRLPGLLHSILVSHWQIRRRAPLIVLFRNLPRLLCQMPIFTSRSS